MHVQLARAVQYILQRGHPDLNMYCSCVYCSLRDLWLQDEAKPTGRHRALSVAAVFLLARPRDRGN
jgi:hypothetical protein